MHPVRHGPDEFSVLGPGVALPEVPSPSPFSAATTYQKNHPAAGVSGRAGPVVVEVKTSARQESTPPSPRYTRYWSEQDTADHSRQLRASGLAHHRRALTSPGGAASAEGPISSSARDVGPYDAVTDPEDDGVDIVAFANFMRSTKAPSRGPVTPAVEAGELLFGQIGCANCHVASVTTARPGTRINGGAFTVPSALGNKIIHPYSDFLLHDIGTGDGIPFLPLPDFASTAAQIRTAPLWGLRTRNRLMHDGLSFTKQEAIERHAGQATAVTSQYNALSNAEKDLILAFLDSL